MTRFHLQVVKMGPVAAHAEMKHRHVDGFLIQSTYRQFLQLLAQCRFGINERD